MCLINPMVCPCCGRCPICGNIKYSYPTITWISGNDKPVEYKYDDSTGGYVSNESTTEKRADV